MILRISRWILVATIALVALSPSSASAHQQLLSASPAAGDTLTAAPLEIRLTFSQSVESALAELRLVGPGGEIALSPHVVPSGAPTVLRAEVIGRLVAGDYIVRWLAVGDDGHPVRGEVPFTVAEGASGLSMDADSAMTAGAFGQSGFADTAAGAATSSEPNQGARAFGSASPLYAALRWLNFAGILIVIGAVSFALLLLPRVGRHPTAPAAGALERARARTASIGLLASIALLVTLGLRLAAQVASMGSAGGADIGSLVTAMLTRTIWGWGWLVQAGALLLALVGFTAARRGSRTGWGTAAVGAVALAVTPALSGHAAATSAVAVGLDALHVLAAGGWLGTLLLLVLAGVPLLVAGEAGARRQHGAALLAAFSPLALGFAALLTVTGLYAAWVHLPELAALWTSPYGRTLLLKLAALSAVFAAGAYNWRAARPALEQREDVRPLRRSASAELVMGGVVLAVTAALVATPPPMKETEMQSQAERASSSAEEEGVAP